MCSAAFLAVLASRERWRPVLENWNPQTGRMTEYPALRFYSSATLVPFERITEIEHVPPPTRHHVLCSRRDRFGGIERHGPKTGGELGSHQVYSQQRSRHH